MHTLEESKWKDLGNHYGHYLKADDHTKLISAHLIKSFETEAYIVTVSQNGNIKRSLIKDYLVSRLSKTYDAMVLSKGDKLVANFVAYADEELVLVSQEGYCVRYRIDMVPTSQPKAKGVKAMNLQAHDKIAYACALSNQNNLVFVCESGLMKRIKTSEITSFNRPAKGELIAKKVKSNPQMLVYVQAAQVYDDIRITHDDKRWIQAKDISLMDKAQTFSQVSDVKDFYIVKRIEDVRIVDFKPEEKDPQVIEDPKVEEHHEVEFIHFDLE